MRNSSSGLQCMDCLKNVLENKLPFVYAKISLYHDVVGHSLIDLRIGAR